MAVHEQISRARLRFLGTSAQKARLVVDQIRGKPVDEALAILKYTRKAVAPEIGALVDSAIANARQKQQDIDVDRLFIQAAYVDGGPSLKRVRPAPMGRAFRVLRRMCHVTVALGQKRLPEPAARQTGAGEAKAGAAVKKAARPKTRAAAAGSGARKTTSGAGKAATRRRAATGKKATGRTGKAAKKPRS